jgi:hypothetical protein
MSHMSEQAGSALGRPPEGEDARGEAAITVGTVQGARTQASRTLSGSATMAARRRVSALLLPGRT